MARTGFCNFSFVQVLRYCQDLDFFQAAARAHEGALTCDIWHSAVQIHLSAALLSGFGIFQAAARARALQGCQATAEAMCPQVREVGCSSADSLQCCALVRDWDFLQAVARAHALQGYQATAEAGALRCEKCDQQCIFAQVLRCCWDLSFLSGSCKGTTKVPSGARNGIQQCTFTQVLRCGQYLGFLSGSCKGACLSGLSGNCRGNVPVRCEKWDAAVHSFQCCVASGFGVLSGSCKGTCPSGLSGDRGFDSKPGAFMMLAAQQ